MLEALRPLLIAQLWQFTVVAAVVAIVVRVACRQRPRLAVALWSVVLVKAVTPPLWSSPVGLFSLLTPERSEPAVRVVEPIRESSDTATGETDVFEDEFDGLAGTVDDPVLAVLGFSDTAHEPVEPRAISGLDSDRATAPNDVESGSTGAVPMPGERAVTVAPIAEDPVATAEGPMLPRWPTSDWLFGLWGCGVATLLLLSVRTWQRIRAAERFRMTPSRELTASFDRVRERLGLRSDAATLIVTEMRLGPAVFGVLRPWIVLPHCVVRRGDAAAWEPILTHELMHVRRRDAWLGLLQTLVQIVWWFHPLAWWANRSLTREIERCCDEDVVRALGRSPLGYARCLVSVLEWKQELERLPAGLAVSPADVTSERLERIMAMDGTAAKPRRWPTRLLWLGLAALILPGAAVGQPEEPTARPAVEPEFGGAQDDPADARPMPTPTVAIFGAEPTTTEPVGTGDVEGAAPPVAKASAPSPVLPERLDHSLEFGDVELRMSNCDRMATRRRQDGLRTSVYSDSGGGRVRLLVRDHGKSVLYAEADEVEVTEVSKNVPQVQLVSSVVRTPIVLRDGHETVQFGAASIHLSLAGSVTEGTRKVLALASGQAHLSVRRTRVTGEAMEVILDTREAPGNRLQQLTIEGNARLSFTRNGKPSQLTADRLRWDLLNRLIVNRGTKTEVSFAWSLGASDAADPRDRPTGPAQAEPSPATRREPATGSNPVAADRRSRPTDGTDLVSNLLGGIAPPSPKPKLSDVLDAWEQASPVDAHFSVIFKRIRRDHEAKTVSRTSGTFETSPKPAAIPFRTTYYRIQQDSVVHPSAGAFRAVAEGEIAFYTIGNAVKVQRPGPDLTLELGDEELKVLTAMRLLQVGCLTPSVRSSTDWQMNVNGRVIELRGTFHEGPLRERVKSFSVMLDGDSGRAEKTTLFLVTGAEVTHELQPPQLPDVRHTGPDASGRLGLRMRPVDAKDVPKLAPPFRGGMQITGVNPFGPAARAGIRVGDVLVGLDAWKTTKLEHVEYALHRQTTAKPETMQFHVLRGSETLFGDLDFGNTDDVEGAAKPVERFPDFAGELVAYTCPDDASSRTVRATLRKLRDEGLPVRLVDVIQKAQPYYALIIEGEQTLGLVGGLDEERLRAWIGRIPRTRREVDDRVEDGGVQSEPSER